MKNSNDAIGNETHDLPACIAVTIPPSYRVTPTPYRLVCWTFSRACSHYV